MVTDYTLSSLTELVGGNRRIIQFWAQHGVIQADPDTNEAGKGVHRRFSRNEAIIACLVLPFAQRQISVGQLKQIADRLRRALRQTYVREAIERAARGPGIDINEAVHLVVVVDAWGEVSRVHFVTRENGETLQQMQQHIGAQATEVLKLVPAMSFVLLVNAYLSRLQ